MNPGDFKAKARGGETVFGTWSHIPSVQVVEVIGASGMDFIVFDLEHGPHSFTEMPALYAAAENSGLAHVTRVPGLENSSVLRCLDCGAKAIMVPHVDSAEKAARSLRAMYYGQGAGNRGIATLTRASKFDIKNEKSYIRAQNDLITSVLMVEDKAVLEDMERICAQPGLDVVFVGIYDLSQNLGLKGDLDDPEFVAVFEDTVKKIRDLGVAVGCYAHDAAGARRLLDIGVSFVTVCVDGGMLRQAYDFLAGQLAALKSK